MQRLPRKIKIGKEDWSIRVHKSCYGLYAGLTLRAKKDIIVFKDVHNPDDPFELFGTLAHEILHARNGGLSEKAVTETETALVSIARAVFGRG